MNKAHPARDAYRRFFGEREGVLDKARECSSLTVNYLEPPDGTTPQTKLPTPYQGTGAEGVNNVASKLSLTLFPNHRASFMLVLNPARVRELAAESGADAENIITDVQHDLAIMEREIQDEIESRAMRPVLTEGLRHLTVGGGGIYQWKPDGGLRLWGLSKYVIKRDAADNILWVVTKESMDNSALPPGVVAKEGSKKTTLYTAMRRTKDGTYRLWQEVNGHIYNPDTVDTFEDGPYIVPRMFTIPGESYGRGLVEHYLGDLVSLEAISRGILQATAAATKVVWMVNPNGFTNARKLQQAKPGGFVVGSPDDVKALQLDKSADLRVAFETQNELKMKLHRVFLLNTAAQRDAERVTAEEVRFVAQQLEDALGGTYSLLNDQLQLPIIRKVIADMRADGRLEGLDDSLVTVRVVTGLEGLGRARDLQAYREFIADAQAAVGVEAFQAMTHARNSITRLASAHGIDTIGLLKSDETLQAEQQAAQEAQANQDVLKPVAGAVAKPLAEKFAETL